MPRLGEGTIDVRVELSQGNWIRQRVGSNAVRVVGDPRELA